MKYTPEREARAGGSARRQLVREHVLPRHGGGVLLRSVGKRRVPFQTQKTLRAASLIRGIKYLTLNAFCSFLGQASRGKEEQGKGGVGNAHRDLHKVF